MKKGIYIFTLIFTIMTLLPVNSFSAVIEKNAKELNAAWGRAYWKICKDFDIGNDHPCIGESKNNCINKSWVTPAWGDEYGILVMAAVEATVGGAKFCPTAAVSKNKYDTSSWTQYYINPTGCVWLCVAGYTGERCLEKESNVKTCDNTLLLQSNYDSIKRMDEKEWTNREAELPNWGANISPTCGGRFPEEHDLIAIISDWLPSGHGAYVRPYIVRAEGDETNDIYSWINLYPAAYTQKSNIYDQNDNVPYKIACKNGYKPNSDNTDCVPISKEVCDGTANLPFCGTGWIKETYESNKDKFDIHYNGWLNGDNSPCKWYTCKGENMAFPSEQKKGTTECSKCDPNQQTGIVTGSGVCYSCPDGKFFDNVVSGHCVDAIALDKDVMKYGRGNNATTSIEKQCWTLEVPTDYKECVMSGTAQKTYKVKLKKLAAPLLKQATTIKK